VIDRLREQLQDRLDQVLSEADRLRKALAALDPRSPSAPGRKVVGRLVPSRRRTRADTAKRNGAPAQTARARRSAGRSPASGSKSSAAARRPPKASKSAAAGAGAGAPGATSSARTRSPRRRTSASKPAGDAATTPGRRRRAATAGPSSAASDAGVATGASQQSPGTTKRARRPRAAASEPAASLLPSDSAATAPGAPATSDTTPSEPPAALSPRRPPAGETRGAVLAALAGDESMTAGQVAERAGLSRATVSTTLSRLAKTGEVQKAERGYQLAPASPPAPSTEAPAAAQSTANQARPADSPAPRATD
jgi:DNA-binding transcriptional ArsR family regulator